MIPLKVLFVRFAPLRSVIGEFRIPGGLGRALVSVRKRG